MSSIELPILGDANRGTKVTIASFSSESVLNISPIDPVKLLGKNVVPYDQLEFHPEFGRQIPDGWGGMKRPEPKFLGSDDEYNAAVAEYNKHIGQYTAETSFDFFIRTANPDAKSVLTVYRQTDDGHSKTSFVTPLTIQEIAAKYPDLSGLITQEAPENIRKPEALPHPESARARILTLRGLAAREPKATL